MLSRDLGLGRIYYFLWIGAVGFSNPFINLFYRQQSLNGAEIGLLITLGSLAGLVAAPMWGRLSDSGISLLRLLQIGLVVTGAILVVRSQLAAFQWLALAVVVQGLAGAGIAPLSDALALRVTEARRAGYGSIRVWGSAGWAVAVPMSGWFIERTSLVAAFVGNAVGFVLAALLLVSVRAAPPQKVPSHIERGGLLHAARSLLHSPTLLGLAGAIIVRGIMNDGQQQFGNIYLEQLGATTAVIGIASMLGAVVELPGMFVADRLVNYLGAARLLWLSFVVSGAKFALILAFPAVWSVLVTRALDGIAVSLYVVGLVRYISANTPLSQLATMLALFSVTLIALVQMLGAPLGGVLFDLFGAYWLYALALVGNLIGCGILSFVSAAQRRSSSA